MPVRFLLPLIALLFLKISWNQKLFGHEKGAFTGAIARRIGKFEEAEGGTLLLDEISEIDVRLQAKLLRVLQERELTRVGSNASLKINVRILATSNRNLQEEVKKGTFREDLFFRLNVITLALPLFENAPPILLFSVITFAKNMHLSTRFPCAL